MRAIVLTGLIGAALVGPASAELKGKNRAEALLDTYTTAMATCDIATFDDLHADNLRGSGPGPGARPVDHIGLEEQCQWGQPDSVNYTITEHEIADGLLVVSADLVLTEAGDNGAITEIRTKVELTSRLTANGDEQIVVSVLEMTPDA